MSVDGEPSKGEAMSKRAIEQIMKLVSSQLSLERNQRRLEKKVRRSCTCRCKLHALCRQGQPLHHARNCTCFYMCTA